MVLHKFTVIFSMIDPNKELFCEGLIKHLDEWPLEWWIKICNFVAYYFVTRELPGFALVNILNGWIFTGKGKTHLKWNIELLTLKKKIFIYYRTTGRWSGEYFKRVNFYRKRPHSFKVKYWSTRRSILLTSVKRKISRHCFI